MSDEDEDYERLAYSQRLKAAVHYTVGQMCKETSEEYDSTFSKQFVAVLAEAAFKQCSTMAVDLELFAKHAKRSVINSDDVKLLARKSPALLEHIKSLSDQQIADKEQKGAKKGRKKKSTATKLQEKENNTLDEDSNMD